MYPPFPTPASPMACIHPLNAIGFPAMKTIVGFASFLALALSVPALAQTPPVPDAALAPKIVCDAPEHDFGTASNSGFVEHDYPIRNEGTLSLEIRDVHASCGCTAVKPSQNIIPPGGEAVIQAKLDLRGRSGFQQKSITVSCNDPATPTLMLLLKGTAIQPLRAEPSSLFFGRIGPDAVRRRTFDVLSSQGPIQIVSTRTDNPGLLITSLPAGPGDENTRHRFELSIDPSLPAGGLNGNVFVKTDRPDLPELSIPVAAFIEQPLPPAPTPDPSVPPPPTP